MDADPPRNDRPDDRAGSPRLRATAARLAASPEVPAEVRGTILRELDVLDRAPASRATQDSVRYLTTLVGLPWEAPAEGWRDLEHVSRVLDHEVRRHAGAHDARDRFVSHAALRGYRRRPGTTRRQDGYLEAVFSGPDALRPGDLDHVRRSVSRFRRTLAGRGSAPNGAPMLLVGPPGVGKTRIAERMADAAGTGFAKIGLAGSHDATALRGFARSWSGAGPSRIASALGRAGRRDAVLLLDEVDKLGEGSWQGAPAEVLLELLDGRSEFRDDYLDLPLPLDEVCWIATANDVSRIPGHLLDRLDVVHVDGYLPQEREMLVVETLWPQALVDAGVVPAPRSTGGVGGADRLVLTPAAARLLSAGAGTRDTGGLRETERRLWQLVAQLTHRAPDLLDEILDDPHRPALVLDLEAVLVYLPELARHRPDDV